MAEAGSFFEQLFFGHGSGPGPVATVIYGFIVVVALFMPFVGLLGAICIWAERKIAGHMQNRPGPNRVGPFGILQSVADGLKCVSKEDLVPPEGDRALFRLSVYLAFAPVFVALVAIPFGPELTFEPHLNSGLFLILAMLGVEVMGVILAGWSSNNKWSIYGAMREACQMVSYEIPLGLSLIIGVMAMGTLNLVQMGLEQGGGIHTWGIFKNPFIFLAFFIYFVASLASNKRAPFDLPESESELVAGYLTEFSGMRWAFFFFAEYTAMFVVGGIQTAMFLGGWNDPFGLIGYYHHVFAADPQSHVVGMIVLNLIGAGIFVAKASAIIFVQMWLRWTLPRPRIDQVLYVCVKVLLPGACVLLLGAALWQLFVPSRGGVPWQDYNPLNWGALTSGGSAVAVMVQMALAAVGVGIFAAIVVWIARAAIDAKSVMKRRAEPEAITG